MNSKWILLIKMIIFMSFLTTLIMSNILGDGLVIAWNRNHHSQAEFALIPYTHDRREIFIRYP